MIDEGCGGDGHVSREQAKQLIDEAEGGFLVVMRAEPVPYIGEEPEERDVDYEMTSVRFGEFEEDREDPDGA